MRRRVGLTEKDTNLCLGLNENDRTIDSRNAGSEHLGLERCLQIVHRREIGVVVDSDQPQWRIAWIAGLSSRDVMRLLRTGLGVEA